MPATPAPGGSGGSGSQTPLVQPRFDSRITTLAFPLTGTGAGQIERGYMVWDKPIPGYSGKASVHYLYNPSTVSADYNIADPTVQAAMNFPIASDESDLAIPLQQTASWTIMFDRTYEVNSGAYNSSGTVPAGSNANNPNDPGIVGVQSDVIQMMQFTGMLTNYSYGTAVSSGLLSTVPTTASTSLAAHSGIMQLVPAYAYFGNASLKYNLAYYGYITEWSVQYTHWTQYNVPFRCVIAINWTMLPPQGNSSAADLSSGASAQSILNQIDTTTPATGSPLPGLPGGGPPPAGVAGR